MEKSLSLKINVGLLALLLVSLVIYYVKLVPFSFRETLIIAVAFIATLPVIVSALRALVNRKVSVDLLASIALFVSLAKGEWASAVFINLMITSARIFGEYTEGRARDAIKGLLKLRPTEVKVRIDSKIVIKPISEVKVGDMVIIESGDRIPVDGIVQEGEASIDQSSLTGESIPIPKGKGDKVFSSTLNISGSLIVKTEKIGKETTFEKIVALVESAQDGKIGIQTTADKFATIYIVATFAGASLLWLLTHNLTLVLSVLLVTCADDIAVAIPIAFWSAVGYAARQGIIIKGGNFLEGLANLKTLVADKTGTLTRGKIKTEEVVPFNGEKTEEVLRLAAFAESVSEHPIARAIAFEAEKKNLIKLAPKSFEEFPGKGIVAKDKGKEVVAGRFSFLEEKKIKFSDGQKKEIHHYQDEGSNVVAVGYAGRPIGFIALSDEVRPNARKTIEKLKALGVTDIVMLTGDNERVAANVAKQVGIEEFHANLLPHDKVAFIKSKLGEHGKLAMVGDGVNDAASLALADVGIAMGTIGSDAAIEAADIALMQDNLGKVAEAISLGRYTARIAKEDFVIWGIVNAIGLALVFGGVIGPAGAAAYNFVTDFFPLLNSLRMFRYKA